MFFSRCLPFLCCWLLCLNCAQAKLYTAPSQLTKTEYDFIIIGGGTAGNVLASRLTEIDSFSVLVIEAGVTNEGVLPAEVPFLAPSLNPNTSVTWNYTTSPQVALNGRTIPYARGRVLGGSSTINFMTYTRGSSDDFDRYAELTGDPGWSWNALIPFMKKTESLVPPADGHNTTGEVNPAVHGNGPVEVSVPGDRLPLDFRVINTTQVLSEEFPFNEDLNSGDAVGIGWVQSSVGNSKRSSSATAYLEPVLGRANLDVLIHTQATKLIQTGTEKGLPTFKQVEVAQDAQSKRFVVQAKNEVILSAGSIGTPQLLMLSGIGNATALRAMGIKSVIDSPDVGQNLQDHPLIANPFIVNSPDTFDDVLRNASLAALALEQWNATGQGLFSNAPGNTIGFLRLPNNASIFQNFTDPAAGPKAGHYEFVFSDGFASSLVPMPANGSFITVVTNVVSPLSRGSVTLENTDPFTFPIIDPAFLTSPFDVFTISAALSAANRFLSASPWAGLSVAPFGELADALATPAGLAAYARKFVTTVWHPVGTARMSPADAAWGVVGPSLLVKGAAALRVVDASILPIIPASHPQAPVYIMAERAADLIKTAWGH